jgi:hypothetical protein
MLVDPRHKARRIRVRHGLALIDLPKAPDLFLEILRGRRGGLKAITVGRGLGNQPVRPRELLAFPRNKMPLG